MAKPTVAAPIASATTPDQLDEIMKAATIKLDAASVEQLEPARKRFSLSPRAGRGSG